MTNFFKQLMNRLPTLLLFRRSSSPRGSGNIRPHWRRRDDFYGYDRYVSLRRMNRIQASNGMLETILPRPAFGPWKALARRVGNSNYLGNDLLEGYLDVAGIGAGENTYRVVEDELRARTHGKAEVSYFDENFTFRRTPL